MRQNLVNHIALVLDESSSMSKQRDTLIAVADDLIKYLAQRSDELAQETRISVFTFADKPRNVIWDMDVLRLPSIKELYQPNGWTALIDATLLALDDLTQTPQKYGDHAFLIYVLTDGAENASRARPEELRARLARAQDARNWTVAALVPSDREIRYATHNGFPAGNVAVWDATSVEGIIKVGSTITAVTDTYMVNRSKGVRSSTGLFSTGLDAVNSQTIAASGIAPLAPSDFMLIPVPQDAPIRDFVHAAGRKYVIGQAYYQLVKTEDIQAQKLVAIVERKTGKVYVGREARRLLNLPDMNVRVKPNFNPDFDIFVQSTSVNRKLPAGTKVLLLF